MRACGDQIGHRAARVTAGHQSLADEHRVGARTGVRQQVGGAADTGFGDPDDVAGQSGGDAGEAIPVDFEGLEVAGVDADHLGAGLQRAVGLLLGVHLDQRGHAERLGAVQHRHQRGLLQRRDDQQQHVGAVRPRLVDLVRADDEVLAQHRDRHRGAHRVQIVERAVEPALLGEHADDAGAAVLVGARRAPPDRGSSPAAPRDGLARLTSAITPMPGARSAAITSSGGGAALAAALISARLTTASRAATSARTPSMMESSTVAELMPAAPFTSRSGLLADITFIEG